MKIFNTSQVKTLDNYTIEHEPISSLNLMERAAQRLFEVITELYPNREIKILAGPGNNGGDALVLALKLKKVNYNVDLHLLKSTQLSSDCNFNLEELIKQYPEIVTIHTQNFIPPTVNNKTLLIDGLFGSGLNRKLEGLFAKAVEWMNCIGCEIVSIDVPSGLHGEINPDLTVPIVKANLTLSLQFPKLSFFFRENEPFVGRFKIIDIQIHPEAIKKAHSDFNYIENHNVKSLLKHRPIFSHKGTYGHLCVVSGKKGMAGASLLSCKAALRAGCGLVTLHGPKSNRKIIQVALPECIFEADKSTECITENPIKFTYDAYAVGPGIGTNPNTVKMLNLLLNEIDKPCIFDADALNIISESPQFIHLLTKNCIITPHPKEFERLVGKCDSDYDRMNNAREFSKNNSVFVVLKGAHTMIFTPDNEVFINSTGNSGMATAGTGDVLTGIIGSLLAQGYEPKNAAILGVFLHGLAGDFSLTKQSKESLIASDLIENLGKSFKYLSEN